MKTEQTVQMTIAISDLAFIKDQMKALAVRQARATNEVAFLRASRMDVPAKLLARVEAAKRAQRIVSLTAAAFA